MRKNDPVVTIGDYIEAGFPCLFLPTAEEAAAEEKIQATLRQLTSDGRDPVNFGVWKVTTGLRIYKNDGSPREQGPLDLVNALDVVENSSTPILCVFYHVRQQIKTPQIIQKIIDMSEKAKTTFSTAIFIGPYLELPPELQDVITYCDFPLPTKQELEVQIEAIARSVEDEIENWPVADKEQSELIAQVATACMGMTSRGAENAVALSLAVTGRFDMRLIQRQKEQEIKKSDVLEIISTTEDLSTIGGFSALKSWLGKRKKAFSEEARKYGLPYPRGILLAGVPGVGKSLAAKAVSNFLGLPLARLDVGKVFRPLVGSSEAAIRSALQIAEGLSPAVLWIDELEKSLAGSQRSGQLDSGVTSRVITTLLTWRQETTYPIFLVGTVNNPDLLPSMIYRKGRFDEIWGVDLPTREERADIFEIHLRKRGRDPEKFSLHHLAKESEGFAGAEIESCVEDAMFTAFSEDTEVTTAHILASISDTIPQVDPKSKEILDLRTWLKSKARSVSGPRVEAPKPDPQQPGRKVFSIARKGGINGKGNKN